MMLNLIVNDTAGRMGMMTGNSGPPVDYGNNIKQAVKDLEAAILKEHFTTGLMN